MVFQGSRACVGGGAEVCSSPIFNLDNKCVFLAGPNFNLENNFFYFSKLLDMNRAAPNKAQRSDKSLSEEVCS